MRGDDKFSQVFIASAPAGNSGLAKLKEHTTTTPCTVTLCGDPTSSPRPRVAPPSRCWPGGRFARRAEAKTSPGRHYTCRSLRDSLARGGGAGTPPRQPARSQRYPFGLPLHSLSCRVAKRYRPPVFGGETQGQAKRSPPRVTEVCSKNPRFFAGCRWPDINKFPPFCFWEPHAGIPGRRPQA